MPFTLQFFPFFLYRFRKSLKIQLFIQFQKTIKILFLKFQFIFIIFNIKSPFHSRKFPAHKGIFPISQQFFLLFPLDLINIFINSFQIAISCNKFHSIFRPNSRNSRNPVRLISHKPKQIRNLIRRNSQIFNHIFISPYMLKCRILIPFSKQGNINFSIHKLCQVLIPSYYKNLNLLISIIRKFRSKCSNHIIRFLPSLLVFWNPIPIQNLHNSINLHNKLFWHTFPMRLISFQFFSSLQLIPFHIQASHQIIWPKLPNYTFQSINKPKCSSSRHSAAISHPHQCKMASIHNRTRIQYNCSLQLNCPLFFFYFCFH